MFPKQFKVDDILLIKGISQKGKNRVIEHGSSWKITVIVTQFPVGIMMAGSMLLESVEDGHVRWITPDDEHFDIITPDERMVPIKFVEAIEREMNNTIMGIGGSEGNSRSPRRLEVK